MKPIIKRTHFLTRTIAVKTTVNRVGPIPVRSCSLRKYFFSLAHWLHHFPRALTVSTFFANYISTELIFLRFGCHYLQASHWTEHSPIFVLQYPPIQFYKLHKIIRPKDFEMFALSGSHNQLRLCKNIFDWGIPG